MKGNDKLAKRKNKYKKKERFTKGKERILEKLATNKMSSKSSNFIDGEDGNNFSEFSEVKEYNINEIKLQIVIEKRGKKTSTFKIIIIKPVNYIDFIEGINNTIQKALKNKDIKPADYSILYKAVNACSPSSALKDKLDFNEFIDDYKKIIAANKKISTIIVIGDVSVDEKTKSKCLKVRGS